MGMFITTSLAYYDVCEMHETTHIFVTKICICFLVACEDRDANQLYFYGFKMKYIPIHGNSGRF